MENHHLHNLSGEQKEQRLVLADKNGKAIGFATRKECHQGRGKLHLAFMAFLFDGNKQMILTKRSSGKSLWANFWDAAIVSHLLPGETAGQAAYRRGKEELGIKTKFKVLGAFPYFAKHGTQAENEYCYVLLGETKEKLHPNPVEIAALEKISLSQLKAKLKKQPEIFTPWLRTAMEKIDLTKAL